eukprot:1150862-Ditylum_brightwellii.AAC.1
MKWCNSGGCKNTLIKTIKADIDALKMDGNTVDGFEYVNQHIMLYTKLDELLTSKMTELSKMQKFVDIIIDKGFKIVQQLLENTLLEIDHGNKTMNAKGFTDMVENQQHGLNKQAELDMEVKSRRANFRNDSLKDSMDKQSILWIPNALFVSFSQEQKKAFLHWGN